MVPNDVAPQIETTSDKQGKIKLWAGRLAIGALLCIAGTEACVRINDDLNHPKRDDCEPKNDRISKFGPLARLEYRLRLDESDIKQEAEDQFNGGILPRAYLNYLYNLEGEWDNESLGFFKVAILLRNKSLREEIEMLSHAGQYEAEKYETYLNELNSILNDNPISSEQEAKAVGKKLMEFDNRLTDDHAAFYIDQLNTEQWLDEATYEKLISRAKTDPTYLHFAINNMKGDISRVDTECWTEAHAFEEANQAALDGIEYYEKKHGQSN